MWWRLNTQQSIGSLNRTSNCFSYILGLTGLYGSRKEFAPCVFNFLRYTLSPQETYKMLNAAPPKQRFEACPFDGGIGIIAFTLPSWSITWIPNRVATYTLPAVSHFNPSDHAFSSVSGR